MITEPGECAATLRHPAFLAGGIDEVNSANLLLVDGARHARLRRIVRSAIATIEPLPANVTGEIREFTRALAGRAEFDIVADFAQPVASMVAGELLGLSDSDGARVFAEIGKITGNLEDSLGNKTDSSAGLFSAVRLMRLLAKARVREGSGLSVLRTARDNGLIDDREIVTLGLFLGHAAVENSANFLGMAAVEIVRDRDIRNAFRDDSNDHRKLVRELVHGTCPAQFVVRHCADDLVIGSIPIRRGGRVLISLRAGPVLGFGLGRHACPGAGVAVDESVAALTEFVGIVGDQARVTELAWKPTASFRGLARAVLSNPPAGGAASENA